MYIGIDIGTHVARAAFLGADGAPHLVVLGSGSTTLPACARQTMHALLIGEEAAQSLVGNAETTIMGCTRLMGRAGQIPAQLLQRLPYSVRQIDGEVTCNVLYAEVSASAVFGQLAHTLASAAQQMTGTPVDGVVLTVPAGAEDRFRVQARAAVEAHGLRVIRLLNQPTAAILGMRSALPIAGNIAIVSCSGATTEVSIAELQPHTSTNLEHGAIRILASATDPLLGGEDLTWAIAEQLNAHFVASAGCDIFAADESRSAALGLRRAAEDLLRELRFADQAPIILDHGGGFGRDLTAIVHRRDIAIWLKPWLDRIAALCRQALTSAKLQATHITQVVLIGEWADLPGLDKLIAAVFDCQTTDLHTSHAPTLAVFGAAYATTLSAATIWDVTPYPLGINCYYGNTERLSPIIRANTPVPTPAAGTPGAFTEHYTTRLPDQTSVTLDILQYRGNRDPDPYGTEPVTPEACEQLGSWQFTGLRPEPGHCANFTVTFSIDQDGILHLRACETATGLTLEGSVTREIGA